LSLVYIFLMMPHLIMELSWEESARTFQILISLSMPIWQLNAHVKWMKGNGLSCVAIAACFWSYSLLISLVYSSPDIRVRKRLH
jgi:hypothetical protein